MNKLIAFWIFIFMFFQLQAQQNTTKILKAIRVDTPPKIDANPDDIQWKAAPSSSGFYMYQPGDGEPLPPEYKTEIKAVYDDVAIYFLAIMKDPQPEKIATEFGLRDQPVQADNFAVMLNPFQTPNNTYMFMVTASGAQIDSNNPTGGDMSWNAVWQSKVKITSYGWVTEIAIPYSALRFQNEKEQTWAVTFSRHIENRKEDYSWTYIDKTKRGALLQFMGKLTGLKNLQPPVRLSLYPYTSGIYNRFQGEGDTNFGFGLDLKYGLSENYTLDATLIPDFSDTPYDELELNLGPFEQYYAEKRQFFTEGFDLFNKGRLFYSRRIGGRPIGYYDVYGQLNAGDEIIDNPENVKLINALKISGRNKNGLGIGFFNAITNKTEASIENSEGEIRKITTEPYANYNIFVLDYNFSGNSSVSFINTNVLRQGEARDANVSAIAWDLYAFHNTLSVGGATAMSLVNENSEYTRGFKYVVHAKKRIKKHSFGSLIRIYDDKYDANDMGFNRTNNYANFDFSYQYSLLKPNKHFNSFKAGIDLGFDHLYKPFVNTQNDVELKFFATNKKYLSYGLGFEFATDSYDYYEPRVPGRYYVDKKRGGFWSYISTDYRKKLAVDVKLARFVKFDEPQTYFQLRLAPRFRFNNQFKMQYAFDYKLRDNFKGYVDIIGEDIIFGNRHQKSITNSLSANYFFNVKSGINLSFRYYWAPVYYDKFYRLEMDGSLTPVDNYSENNDINFNIWNVDLGYAWEFAPGSKLSLLYRNTIYNSDQLAHLSYAENFERLMDQPQKHSFIMKMTYYIDYNTLKQNWF